MQRYFIFSIPVVLAAIVGFIAYGVKLASLDVPSEEEIGKAPVREKSGKANAIQRAADEAAASARLNEYLRKRGEAIEAGKDPDDVVMENEPKSTPKSETPAPRVPSRRELEVKRNNAYITARKTGATAAITTAILGYIALVVVVVTLGKRRPKGGWRDAIATAPPTAHDDVTPYEYTTYEQDDPAAGDDEGPYEPYEAPIDLSELEAAHESADDKPPGE